MHVTWCSPVKQSMAYTTLQCRIQELFKGGAIPNGGGLHTWGPYLPPPLIFGPDFAHFILRAHLFIFLRK